VSAGDILVEIETDKAVMEYESYEDGYLVQQTASEGETVPIGEVIGILGDSPDAVPEDTGAGAPPEDKGEDKAEEKPEGKPEEKAPEPAPAQEASPAPAAVDGPRPRTSPLARRLATEYGLGVTESPRSGPKGRVVRADVQAAAEKGEATREEVVPAAEETRPAAAQAQTVPAYDDGRDSEELKTSNVRRVI